MLKQPGAQGIFIWDILGLAMIIVNLEASEIVQVDATQCIADKIPRLKISQGAAFFNVLNIEQKQFHLLQKVDKKIIPGIRCAFPQ